MKNAGEAYELKEAYCRCLKKMGRIRSKEAKQGVIEFYQKVEQDILEFKNAIRTFKNRESEILNSFLFGGNQKSDEGSEKECLWIQKFPVGKGKNIAFT